MSIAVDASGNAYITGSTESSNFPLVNPFQSSLSGGRSAFVTKLNAAGSALVYSTYLGGNSLDYGEGIAVDAGGNAYVIGHTYSTNFPTASPIQGALAGNYDAFVTKLNAAGSALVYSTYLGGNDEDAAKAISVDASGNAYVAGYTSSGNFPTANPLQPAGAGGFDVFATKLNANGSGLVYSTYLGGSGRDEAHGIAVDPSGNVYVTGFTGSTNFPTANALQPTYGGGAFDVFAAKLNPTGSALVYSTYLGGNGDEDNPNFIYPGAQTGIYPTGKSIAVDASGNAYVTGGTTSTNFPTASPLQALSAGGYDSFVSVLNASGSGLLFSTYLGGTADDLGMAIAVDASGSAYIVGTTNSTNFPTLNAFQSAYGGGASDVFVAKIAAYAASIQQPINSDGSSIFNVTRGVVPVKFTLTLGGSPTCDLPPATISLTRTAGSAPGPIDESVYIAAADTGSNFRISGCQYVYNLSSNALGPGTYEVDISIGGGVVGKGIFALK